ncbi:hypothetical protein [Piscinibacter defluvii]|uniref:hypothetical protein n=1 Tax=Piscinibacter defluvii TaxID=1796922 RepID=UPI000FDF50B4|nr:hypothetical protein [Piscinibacter defluvii]
MTLFEELRKPFNLVSTTIAVVSLLLSVYFYVASIQKREPVYLVRTSSQIFSKSVTSPRFTVVDAEGKAVQGDIYVVEVSFWNDGGLPIEPSDVRTPVFVEFPVHHRVLDAKVVGQNKPAISNFRISEQTPVDGGGPRLLLAWSHLDPGVGARLQFIYVGDRDAPLTFHGDILDAKLTDAAGLLRRVGNSWVSAVVLVLLGVAVLVLPDKVKISPDLVRSKLARALLGLMVFALGLGTAFAMAWFLFAPKVAPV